MVKYNISNEERVPFNPKELIKGWENQSFLAMIPTPGTEKEWQNLSQKIKQAFLCREEKP